MNKKEKAMQQLDEIKSIYSEAQRTSQNLSKKDKQIKSLIDQLNKIQTDANFVLKKYRREQRLISQKLERAETFYKESFLPLREKILNRKTGLKKALAEADTFRKDLEERKKRIKEVNTEFRATIQSIRKISASIKSIEAKARNNEELISIGLDNININVDKAKDLLSLMKSKLEETQLSHSEIDKILKICQEHSNKINSLLEKSENSNELIQAILSEATETNNKISNLYEIATNKTMAGAFDERRKALFNELGKWYTSVRSLSVIWFLLILLILVGQIWCNNWSIQNLSYEFYLRFLYTLPIAYYLFFCVSQFSSIRKSHERYAFKTTVALSIEAHTELLRRNFDLSKYEERILEFSMDSLKKIYDEPYYSERVRENVDLKKQEVKGNRIGFAPFRFWTSKENELYKLLNKLVDKTMP